MICGPSEQALAIFDGYVDPATGIAAPVMAVLGASLADLGIGVVPDASGGDPTAQVLQSVIDLIGQPLVGAGLSLIPVGAFRPARAADADGLQAEVAYPYGLGRMYLAAFTPRRDFGVAVIVITSEVDKAVARQVFDDTLASLHVGAQLAALTPPAIPPEVTVAPPTNVAFDSLQVLVPPEQG